MPCLVPDFIGIVSSFSRFTLMLSIGLLHSAFTKFMYGPWIPILANTYSMKGHCILSKDFSEFNEMIICFFLFGFAYIEDYIDIFLYIETFLHSWDEAHSIIMNDFSNVFLHSVCKNCIEYFCINIHEGNRSEVLYLCAVFVLFRYKHNCGFI